MTQGYKISNFFIKTNKGGITETTINLDLVELCSISIEICYFVTILIGNGGRVGTYLERSRG